MVPVYDAGQRDDLLMWQQFRTLSQRGPYQGLLVDGFDVSNLRFLRVLGFQRSTGFFFAEHGHEIDGVF